MSADFLAPTDSPVHLSAELPVDWKAEVEELLFFNPQQAVAAKKILATIRAFGMPRVTVANDRLHVVLGDGLTLGTLFARVATPDGDELAGVLLFLRRDTGLLCLHLSVAEAYSLRGPHAGLGVAARLLDGARRIAGRIAGLDHIAVYYNRLGWQKLPLTVRLA